MAKQSFDSEDIFKRPADELDKVETAVAVKAILQDDPSRKAEDVDPLEEICSLAKTAGLEITAGLTQRRPRPHPKSYVGKGKVQELKELIEAEEADIVIVDDPLSPNQARYIEEETGTRVIDRIELIMDIFATHARSFEAKLQVEIAQLRYLAPRLKRMWTHLSRMEGGIGMRGPGETQLETDRRIIGKKIAGLKAKLKTIEQQRHTQHAQRGTAFRVALVGYTNAGKSSLLKALTGANVLIEDKLFSTLDTSTRQWDISGLDVILSDTVGFIRKLPHSLVASFRATLMEAKEADLLLHVVDCSTGHVEGDIQAVEETLERLGCLDQRTFMIFNKIDKLPEERRIDLQFLMDKYPEHIVVSANAGTNLTNKGGLTERVLELVEVSLKALEYLLPLDRGDLVAQLRGLGEIEVEQYREDGIYVCIQLEVESRDRFNTLLAKNGLQNALIAQEETKIAAASASSGDAENSDESP